MQIVRTVGWLACVVYSTIPLFWFMVHPQAHRWREKERSPFRVLVPAWLTMWVGIGAITGHWRNVALYSTPWAWVPAATLFATGIFLYSRSGAHFSWAQLGGLPEVRANHGDDRLITTGIRSRVRHPVYLGHLCEMLAWSIGSGLLVCWLLTAFSIATGAVMIRMEDAELERRFGKEFNSYRNSVPAILPIIRLGRGPRSEARTKMRFEFFIASRYLRAKRRQAFIGIITGISIAGVAAGVASLVVALAINNGFRQDLQQRLLGSTSHISLQRIADHGIKDWPGIMERLSHEPHVVAAAPAIFEQVLISSGPRARGAVLKGMIPTYERQVGDLLNSVTEGSAAALEESSENSHLSQSKQDSEHLNADKSNASDEASAAAQSPDSLEGVQARMAAMPPIVLGKDMADSLGAKIGDPVLVTSPQGELTPYGMVPKYTRFKVVGIFNSGFFDYDSTWAFTRLSDAQRLFGLGNLISVLEFKIDDLDRADAVTHEIEDAAGQGFMATNALKQNSALFKALKTERLVTFITIGLIVFVAALNILISLIMMVMEKTKDIAVLMSMGTRKAQVRNVFIAQGVLIGVIGTVIGLVLGYAVAYAGGHYHVISLSPEVYSIDYVPFAPRLADGIWIAIFTLLVSFVATLYPSWSASRILPAEALRYE